MTVPTSVIDQGWNTAEQVTLIGYTGPAQDPQMSPDGKYLIFDTHNDSGAPSWLYWAKVINYKTFQVMGKIGNVNFGPGQVRGNLDRNNNFYFASMGYASQYGGARVGHGVFSNGYVTNVSCMTELQDASLPPGYFILDGMVTPNGSMIYYNIFQYPSGSPMTAQIKMAGKNENGTFTKTTGSDDILQNVNAVGTVYGSQPSDDGLSLYFTVGGLTPTGSKILFASRASVAEPFGAPQIVKGANELYGGMSMNEGGSLSPDGKHLYFHRVVDPRFSAIFVLTRP